MKQYHIIKSIKSYYVKIVKCLAYLFDFEFDRGRALLAEGSASASASPDRSM